QGQPLEEAFRRLPAAYPRRLAPLVEAGVRTGKLPFLLQRAVEHLRQPAELRRRGWINLMYPCFTITFAFFILAVVFLWIVPDLGNVLSSFGVKLPWITLALIEIANAGRWMADRIGELFLWLGWRGGPLVLVVLFASSYALWRLAKRLA